MKEEVRARAKRRRSPWNLLLIPAMLSSWAALWLGSAKILGLLYASRHKVPDFVFLPENGAATIMALSPLFGSIAPAMVLANGIVWLVPPARRALETEARPHPGTGFVESNRELIRISAWTISVSWVIALPAALI